MGSQSDLDQGGTFRQYQKVWMGPSVGWLTVPVDAILEVTAAGVVTLQRWTNLIKININGAVTFNLPSSKASISGPQAIPGQWVLNPVTFVDIGGFAGGVLYRMVPFGAELISGQASVDLAAPYGTIILEPILDTGGWTLIQ